MEVVVRMMLKVSMDVQAANRLASEGRLADVIGNLLEDIRPEASYFFADAGKRTGCFFFDLRDVSQIPQLAEPLFQNLNAELQLVPVMNHEELMRGLASASPSR